jgi:CubicO group peptidase (beta-lactamase class C family)
MNASTYFPEPESRGGWRHIADEALVREVAGMDSAKLTLACERNAQFNATSAVVIIRHGWLVCEWYENHSTRTSRFDLRSATKTFTATAWGILEAENGAFDFDTPAYTLIPEGHPLSDERKSEISLRHLLTMTSGIPGVKSGIDGVPTESSVGPFEAALGFAPCKARKWPAPRQTARLAFRPGADWDYSDPAWAHLSLAFANIARGEVSEFMRGRVFDPIGIEHASWDLDGGGRFLGPHTKSHSGLHMNARELARFGYLLLHRGCWNRKQIIPDSWLASATQSSQPYEPRYGYGCWVNTSSALWPGAPRDAFSAWGYNMNSCYVVPSLDLVAVRLGTGPSEWDESVLLERIVDAILE